GGYRAADFLDVDRPAYTTFCDVRRRQPEEHPGRQRRLRLAWHQRCSSGISDSRRSGDQCQPDPRRWAGGSPARMDPDSAQYRYRDAAGAGAYADRRAPPRPGVSRSLLPWLRPRFALSGRRDRRPAKGCGWGGADHRGPGRDDPPPGAAKGGYAHDADSILVVAARRPWRAALLGAGAAGGVPWSDRIAGRRIWLWLRLRRQPGRAAKSVRRP